MSLNQPSTSTHTPIFSKSFLLIFLDKQQQIISLTTRSSSFDKFATYFGIFSEDQVDVIDSQETPLNFSKSSIKDGCI